MKNYDYIIVGAGAAGCIIARRLAERTNAEILLVEAGNSDEGDARATDLSRLDEQDSSYDWGYTAKATPTSEEAMAYSRAKILGGCANHNDCAFIQPPDSDFNDWPETWQADKNRTAFERIKQQLHIESSPPGNILSRAFIDANIECGLPELNFRDVVSSGTGWFPLNAKGSLRQSSSIGYLHPLARLPSNLTIKTQASVDKILLTGNKAVGISIEGQKIFSNKEIVLCAGSINTSHLLMLSGIGDYNQLKQAGIKCQHHLPSVGENLMDHAAANIVYELKQPVPNWSLTPCEATALIQIDENAPAPDILFHAVLRLREKHVGTNYFNHIEHGIKLSPNVARPRSRGNIRIVSSDSDSQPQINLNYFSDDEGYDLRILRAGLNYARSLAETKALKPWIKTELLPGKSITSDDDLTNYILANCETVFHPSGTCKMGDVENPSSVVTSDLRVIGIDGLRVADASVFSNIPTVNICNTVMMIAERAADMITQSKDF